MNIGFIGLGIMGKPMAKNLLKKGYKLLVNDHKEASMNELVEAGATAATSEEIAKTCDVVITMLPNGPDVKALIMGENGIGKQMRPGSIFVDMSSISPVVDKELVSYLTPLGVRMLDAPVSGGEPKAIDGTLSIMVGGEKEVFDEVCPMLQAMGSSVVLCGPVGAGNTTKLANQIIVAVNIAAVSEAMMLAKKAGINPELVFDAIKGGLAGSTVMNAKMPMILEKDYKPGFRIDLHIKDLNNAIETAHSVGTPIPLTVEVMEMLQVLRADGAGKEDHSAISKYYEKLTGITIA